MQQQILLIDDDGDELLLFEDALHRLCYENEFKCTHVQSAVEALDMLQGAKPDYIFVDLNMPAMNGIEFLIKARTESISLSTKIYLHSTNVTDITYQKAMLEGAAGCIRKLNSVQGLANELVAVLVPARPPIT